MFILIMYRSQDKHSARLKEIFESDPLQTSFRAKRSTISSARSNKSGRSVSAMSYDSKRESKIGVFKKNRQMNKVFHQKEKGIDLHKRNSLIFQKI